MNKFCTGTPVDPVQLYRGWRSDNGLVLQANDGFSRSWVGSRPLEMVLSARSGSADRMRAYCSHTVCVWSQNFIRKILGQ